MEQTASQRLKEIRITENFSQEEFAKEIGVSLSGYQLIEQGKRDVNSKILESLKSKFDVSADWVLFGEARVNTVDLNTLINDFNKSKELNAILNVYIKSWMKLVLYHLAKNKYYECFDLLQIQIKESDKTIAKINRIMDAINFEIADYTVNPSSDLAENLKSSIKKYFKILFEFINLTKGMGNISDPVIDKNYDWTGELVFEVGLSFDEIAKDLEKKTEELVKHR